MAITAVVSIVILGTGAFIGLSMLKDEPPPPEKRAKTKVEAALPSPMAKAITPQKAEKGPAGSTPTKGDLGEQLAHAPKKAIDQAQNAVAAKRKLEQDRIDAMAAGTDVSEKRALATPLPGQLGGAGQTSDSAAKAPTSPTQASSGAAAGTSVTQRIVTATVDEKPQVPASAAFRQYVSEIVIRGVFQGNPPRASLNGRTFRAGDVVDKGLGVVFVGIDADKKTITFRDASGAVITRKYM